MANKINRVVLVDHDYTDDGDARRYDKIVNSVDAIIQDDGRTLKLFVNAPFRLVEAWDILKKLEEEQ